MKAFSKITALATMAVISTAFLTSCEIEYYKEELYRKEIFIVSGENNIIGQEFTYGGDEKLLSIYASGTKGVDEDVSVKLGLDRNAIGEYNQRNFDTQFDSYALELPAANYTIDLQHIEMKSGTSASLCPVTVTIDGLLPDETYFIPLRIESVSAYMASSTKNFALFKILRKNDYATTKSDTYYTMNGTTQEGWVIDNIFGSSTKRQAINSSKLVLPIDAHSIRILPAAKVLSKKPEIRNSSIRVTVDPETWVNVPIYSEGVLTGESKPMQKVTLTPYIDSSDAVAVSASPKDVCSYDPETQTFYLYYRYKFANESNWHEVRETMIRAQY